MADGAVIGKVITTFSNHIVREGHGVPRWTGVGSNDDLAHRSREQWLEPARLLTGAQAGRDQVHADCQSDDES